MELHYVINAIIYFIQYMERKIILLNSIMNLF